MSADFLVSEITVQAQYKVWVTSATVRGDSGGTDLTWKVTPLEGKEAWTRDEAALVSLKVRKDLQAMLIMDARARGCPEPDSGEETLANYVVAMKCVNPEVGEKEDLADRRVKS